MITFQEYLIDPIWPTALYEKQIGCEPALYYLAGLQGEVAEFLHRPSIDEFGDIIYYACAYTYALGLDLNPLGILQDGISHFQQYDRELMFGTLFDLAQETNKATRYEKRDGMIPPRYSPLMMGITKGMTSLLHYFKQLALITGIQAEDEECVSWVDRVILENRAKLKERFRYEVPAR